MIYLGDTMVDIKNIFIPMTILTDFYSYEKILKKSKNKLNEVRSIEEKNTVLNECKKEINNWNNKVLIKSCMILALFLIATIICILYLKLNFTEYLIIFSILLYLFCFILDAYRKKELIIDKLQKNASNIGFVSFDDILIA